MQRGLCVAAYGYNGVLRLGVTRQHYRASMALRGAQEAQLSPRDRAMRRVN